mgnify:FL=1
MKREHEKGILAGTLVWFLKSRRDSYVRTGVDPTIQSLIDDIENLYPDHDCHASPEDGCAGCPKTVDDILGT